MQNEINAEDRALLDKFIADNTLFLGPDPEIMRNHSILPRSRTEQVAEMRRVLLEHRAPDTVVVVGRDIGREEESLTVTTLAGLDVTAVDMKCLLLVGASSTTVGGSGRVWTPRFVEG